MPQTKFNARALPVEYQAGYLHDEFSNVKRALVSADNPLVYADLPVGSGTWDPGAGAVVTMARAVVFAIGLTVTTGGITVSAGTTAVQALTATTITATGDITMSAAASRLIPGVTSWALRNTANNADNFIVTDAGVATIRAGLTVTAGTAFLSGGISTTTIAASSDIQSSGAFYNTTGTTLCLNATATTIFTLPGASQIWMVFATGNGGVSQGSWGVFVKASDSTTAMFTSNNYGSMTISLSGSNVQITQTNGTSINTFWHAIRLH